MRLDFQIKYRHREPMGSIPYRVGRVTGVTTTENTEITEFRKALFNARSPAHMKSIRIPGTLFMNITVKALWSEIRVLIYLCVLPAFGGQACTSPAAGRSVVKSWLLPTHSEKEPPVFVFTF